MHAKTDIIDGSSSLRLNIYTSTEKSVACSVLLREVNNFSYITSSQVVYHSHAM